MPADLHKVRPHQVLNRNLDHNWQQALQKTSSERRIAVDIELSGWQEQLVLTMTCEDGVSVTHTLDGEFAEATHAEKALANLRDGVAKLGQPSILPAMCGSISPARCLCPTACSTSCVGKRQNAGRGAGERRAARPA
jgi:hypothetical protein